MPQNYGCAEIFLGPKSFGQKYIKRWMVEKLLRFVKLAAEALILNFDPKDPAQEIASFNTCLHGIQTVEMRPINRANEVFF